MLLFGQLVVVWGLIRSCQAPVERRVREELWVHAAVVLRSVERCTGDVLW